MSGDIRLNKKVQFGINFSDNPALSNQVKTLCITNKARLISIIQIGTTRVCLDCVNFRHIQIPT